MTRHCIVGLVATGLCVLLGCSEDVTVKVDQFVQQNEASTQKEAGADLPATAKEAGADLPRKDMSTTKPYSVMLGLLQYEGNVMFKDMKLGAVLATVDREDPVVRPDFIDSPTPPNCYAYTWKKDGFANQTAYDAGDLSITGFNPVKFRDGKLCLLNASDPSCLPANQATLPSTIKCTRKQLGSTSLYAYDCGLYTMTEVAASLFGDATTVDISATGGKDVPSFGETKIPVGRMKDGAVTQDLNLDPRKGVTITWDPTKLENAVLVSVALRTWLFDNSEYTNIVCSAMASQGSKTIPQGALDLLPKVTDPKNALVVVTLVAAINVVGTIKTWGAYKIGAGSGKVGFKLVDTINP